MNLLRSMLRKNYIEFIEINAWGKIILNLLRSMLEEKWYWIYWDECLILGFTKVRTSDLPNRLIWFSDEYHNWVIMISWRLLNFVSFNPYLYILFQPDNLLPLLDQKLLQVGNLLAYILPEKIKFFSHAKFLKNKLFLPTFPFWNTVKREILGDRCRD